MKNTIQPKPSDQARVRSFGSTPAATRLDRLADLELAAGRHGTAEFLSRRAEELRGEQS